LHTSKVTVDDIISSSQNEAAGSIHTTLVVKKNLCDVPAPPAIYGYL
jgi:hypothetical protein